MNSVASPPGKSIRLFLVDGTPGGLITAEIPNWTGHALAGPRSRLAELLKRPESCRPGLYMLLGQELESGEPLAYIGESEALDVRLPQHARSQDKGGRDFWDRVVLITSKDANLTKSHLRYVESRLITLALASKRVPLDNTKGTINEYGLLPEADRADMSYFIEQLRLLLPVLGVDILKDTGNAVAKPIGVASFSAVGVVSAVPEIANPYFELSVINDGIYAKAAEVDGEFIVEAGALGRAHWSAAQQGLGYAKLHAQLIAQGLLTPEAATPGLVRLIDAHAFKSPSAASAVLLGRADNGRKSWRVIGTGQTYADWQNSQIEPTLVKP